MSTPNVGPETAGRPQGLSQDAVQALGSLTPAQQEAMNHVVNAVKAVAPMINAVARCIRGIRNTMSRLYQGAQRLVSTDRALNQSQGGRHRAEQSSRLSMPTREAMVQARDRGRSLVRDASVALASGAVKAGAAVGRWAWSKAQQGMAVAGDRLTKEVARGQAWANENVKPVVQAADDKLTKAADWAGGKIDQGVAYGNQQMSRAAARASAALAGFAARRMDPSLKVEGQQLPKADRALVEKMAEVMTAAPEQRAAKVAELAQLVEVTPLKDPGVAVEKPGGPAVEGGARTAAATHELAWALNANAPANSMRPPAKAGEAGQTAGEQAPGAHTKKEGPEANTPSRD